MKKIYAVGLAGLLVLSGSYFAGAQETASDGAVHNPSPEEIAAQQPEQYNPETGQFAPQPLALGSAMADLVFTPVTPCRLVDTRIGTGAFLGPITAGTTIGIDTDGGGGLAAQGGSVTGCGSWNNVAAIAVTVTAVTPSTVGHFQLFPYLGALPNASVLNYQAGGGNLANTTIVMQNTSLLMPEISLYTAGTTHFVMDVVGYFDPPAITTPSQYVTSSGEVSVGPGTQSVHSPACPTGYRLSGGGGLLNTWTADAPMVGGRPSDGGFAIISGANVADRWLCQFNNRSGFAQNVACFAVCLRIP